MDSGISQADVDGIKRLMQAVQRELTKVHAEIREKVGDRASREELLALRARRKMLAASFKRHQAQYFGLCLNAGVVPKSRQKKPPTVPVQPPFFVRESELVV